MGEGIRYVERDGDCDEGHCHCMWGTARAADDDGVIVDWAKINHLFDSGMGWREAGCTNRRAWAERYAPEQVWAKHTSRQEAEQAEVARAIRTARLAEKVALEDGSEIVLTGVAKADPVRSMWVVLPDCGHEGPDVPEMIGDGTVCRDCSERIKAAMRGKS
jgi:hypothetical protein